LNKTLPEIVEYTHKLDNEAKALIRDTLRLAWHMRGAISANDAYMLSYEEREIISDIVKENMDWTKESGQPFI
jgi:hypothetical protein